jgi:hypothetical protein
MQSVGILAFLAALFAVPVTGLGAVYLFVALLTFLLPNAEPPTAPPTSAPIVWRPHRAVTAALAVTCMVHAVLQYLLTSKLLPVSGRWCLFLSEVVGMQCGESPRGQLATIGVPFVLLAVLSFFRYAEGCWVATSRQPAGNLACSALAFCACADLW